MRVLFIEPSGGGGIAHCTYALAHALGQQGIQCHILTSRRWEDRSLPETVAVHRVFQGLKTPPLQLWNTLRRFQHEVDIVHWQTATYPLLIRALMGMNPLQHLPWVYTVHNVLPHEGNRLSYYLYKQIYRRVQGLIFHTHHSWQSFQQVFDLHADTVYHDIIPLGEYGFLLHPEVMNSCTADPERFLFLGHIRPYKGLDVLLEAMASVVHSCPNATLKIVGQEIESFAPYRKMIQRLNLQSHIDVQLGYLPDEELSTLVASSSIAVLPYKAIDQSAVLMLMMAAGKAIVASQTGGIDEVIRHEETGLLVPVMDAQALAQSMMELLTHPAKTRHLGQQAKKEALSRFSWKLIARKTSAFYERCLQQGNAK